MEKIIFVEGMMCQNCVKHVTHALESLPGATQISVSLEEKKATVSVPESVSDNDLKAVICEAGYEVTEIQTNES